MRRRQASQASGVMTSGPPRCLDAGRPPTAAPTSARAVLRPGSRGAPGPAAAGPSPWIARLMPPRPVPARRAAGRPPGRCARAARRGCRRGRRWSARRGGCGRGRARSGARGRGPGRAGAAPRPWRGRARAGARGVSWALQVRLVPRRRAAWRSRAATMRARTSAEGGAACPRIAVADGRATVRETSMRSSSGPLRRRRWRARSAAEQVHAALLAARTGTGSTPRRACSASGTRSRAGRGRSSPGRPRAAGAAPRARAR